MWYLRGVWQVTLVLPCGYMQGGMLIFWPVSKPRWDTRVFMTHHIKHSDILGNGGGKF